MKGTTALNTPGASHRDDLKVVRGIGPQMEALLVGFGITSWEQLAAMSDEDVAAVSAALGTFPDRIQRDRWIAQAKQLVQRHPLTTPYHRPTSTD